MKIKISELPIAGAQLLFAFSSQDKRGSLSKYYEGEMGKMLGFAPAEVLTSQNSKNVVRGLHYQHPHAQHKIVWCISGRIFEVLLDLRLASPTYGKWHGVELSAKKATGVFVPEGVAHGFASLEENSTILYVLGGSQVPQSERGIRFDDPQLGIDWRIPSNAAVVSDKDRAWPLFKDAVKF